MPPKMVLELALRNGLEGKLPFRSEEEAAAAFQYRNLQEFLDLRDATLQVGALDMATSPLPSLNNSA